MKLFTELLLVFIVFFNVSLFSQIPNAGFENWTEGEPDGWLSNNILGFANPVTQSATSHTGSSSLKLEVISTVGGDYAGYVWSGENFLEGFPVSQAHGSLSGYYQLSSEGDDEMYVLVYMLKEGNFIGIGATILSQDVSSFTQFTVPIQYQNSEVPDTAFIWIGISDSSDGTVSPGTFCLIDDLSFGGPTDIKVEDNIATSFSLEQNYPNPFNPSTKINFSIPEQSYVDLTVYNILGNEITRLVSDNYPAGKYSVDFTADNLPAGVYFAKISAGKYSGTVKMILLK